jgi:hypothetical protein
MDAAVRSHFYSAIKGAKLIEDPFPHLYATEVFPADFYRHLIDSLPPAESYKQYSERYSARYALDITANSVKGLKDGSDFWIAFESWLNSTELLNALFGKFGDRMKSCYELRKKWIDEATTADGVIVSSQSLLCRDFANFAMDPHTDAAPKLVVGIFYFSKDESLIEFGTSLYRPKDPSLRDFDSKRMQRDQFDLVKTFENRPNSFAAFLKTDNSFHGVEDRPHSNVGRDVLFWIPRLGNIRRRARAKFDQEVEGRGSPNVVPASVFTPAHELAS